MYSIYFTLILKSKPFKPTYIYIQLIFYNIKQSKATYITIITYYYSIGDALLLILKYVTKRKFLNYSKLIYKNFKYPIEIKLKYFKTNFKKNIEF